MDKNGNPFTSFVFLRSVRWITSGGKGKGVDMFLCRGPKSGFCNHIVPGLYTYYSQFVFDKRSLIRSIFWLSAEFWVISREIFSNA